MNTKIHEHTEKDIIQSQVHLAAAAVMSVIGNAIYHDINSNVIGKIRSRIQDEVRAGISFRVHVGSKGYSRQWSPIP